MRRGPDAEARLARGPHRRSGIVADAGKRMAPSPRQLYKKNNSTTPIEAKCFLQNALHFCSVGWHFVPAISAQPFLTQFKQLEPLLVDLGSGALHRSLTILLARCHALIFGSGTLCLHSGLWILALSLDIALWVLALLPL